MLNFSKVFPEIVNNQLHSPKAALWIFILFTALMTWRSIIHMFFESFGFQNIANFVVLSGDPDPMPIIYRFFSLWGSAQLLFCLFCWIVIFKYKSLIPLMSVFWMLDWGQRLFIYPFIRMDIFATGEYTNGLTPGVDLAPIVFAITVVMFLVSITNKKIFKR
ncbi:MAG: hypothetical protein CMD58_00930 [Gammaproteobacteria bacterium]|nr:hypothetical protein [Gammaproteobacteria bacterium]|tara:strand:+ start:587 stop:1072 length:486 start_codon:yes stop_codon:yes gene_type:complete